MVLIAACFLGSGVIRVFDSDAAIAEEVTKATQAMTAITPNIASEPKSCPAPLEPASLLTAIQEREQQLDQRETRLANREQVLRVSRIRIDEELRRLQEMEEKLNATIARANNAAEQDIDRVTSVYENMKAANAAQLFQEMDDSFAAGFLMRMRPDAAAGIMANLTPDKAYAISIMMASRNANAPKE